MLPMYVAPAAAAGGGGGSGPSAAPSSGASEIWGGDKVGLFWINGDATASTRIYYKDDASGCPSVFPDDLTLVQTVAPGVNSFETSYTDFCNWFLVHYKDGIFSAWHQVVTGDSSGCSVCPL